MIICSSFRFNLFTLCAASLQGSSMWLPHSKQVVISVSQIKVRLYTFSVPQSTPVTRYYTPDNPSYRNLPPTVFPDLSAYCSLPPPLDSVILYRPQPPFLPRLSPSSDLAWIREFPLIFGKNSFVLGTSPYLFTLCAASHQESFMSLPHSKLVEKFVAQIKVCLYSFSVPLAFL